MNRRPTIRDVASAVGVSVTTVSHALNDKGRVDASTRERVRTTADRLGYRPDRTALRLRLGRSGTLALLLPSVEPDDETGGARVLPAPRRRRYRAASPPGTRSCSCCRGRPPTTCTTLASTAGCLRPAGEASAHVLRDAWPAGRDDRARPRVPRPAVGRASRQRRQHARALDVLAAGGAERIAYWWPAAAGAGRRGRRGLRGVVRRRRAPTLIEEACMRTEARGGYEARPPARPARRTRSSARRARHECAPRAATERGPRIREDLRVAAAVDSHQARDGDVTAIDLHPRRRARPRSRSCSRLRANSETAADERGRAAPARHGMSWTDAGLGSSASGRAAHGSCRSLNEQRGRALLRDRRARRRGHRGDRARARPGVPPDEARTTLVGALRSKALDRLATEDRRTHAELSDPGRYTTSARSGWTASCSTSTGPPRTPPFCAGIEAITRRPGLIAAPVFWAGWTSPRSSHDRRFRHRARLMPVPAHPMTAGSTTPYRHSSSVARPAAGGHAHLDALRRWFNRAHQVEIDAARAAPGRRDRRTQGGARVPRWWAPAGTRSTTRPGTARRVAVPAPARRAPLQPPAGGAAARRPERRDHLDDLRPASPRPVTSSSSCSKALPGRASVHEEAYCAMFAFLEAAWGGRFAATSSARCWAAWRSTRTGARWTRPPGRTGWPQSSRPASEVLRPRRCLRSRVPWRRPGGRELRGRRSRPPTSTARSSPRADPRAPT